MHTAGNHARTTKRAQLLEMALGVFDAAGVVRLQLHRDTDVSSVSALLVYSFEELETVAEANGSIRRLLDEKWTKVYKANMQPPTLRDRCAARRVAVANALWMRRPRHRRLA